MAYDTEDYWYDLHEKDLTPLQLEIYKCIGYESFELLSIGRIEAIIQASERYKRTKAASKQALKTRNEQVMQDYAAGLTYREIGEKYGISKDCVATIIYRERKKSKVPHLFSPPSLHSAAVG